MANYRNAGRLWLPAGRVSASAGAISVLVLSLTALPSQFANAAEQASKRQIEEVVVTAERKESTVSDTSISITAFTPQLMQELGIRNQEDLQNFIPAAVIEPYDMAIRGVGRNFRSLGGDPGIATYLNGVYSEDFGIASTEGGLFDIARIEVLRGPQGTLYGRNAIGGAVNFINNLPTDEFEGEVRGLGGSYGLAEGYLMLSGPIIKEKLDTRFTYSKRTRDGYVDDESGHSNPDNYDDQNWAVGLLWTPSENFKINSRYNKRNYHRRMGGADAAGIVNFTENAGTPDQVTGYERNTSTFAWGWRRVDPTGPACPTLIDRTNPTCVIVPGVTANADTTLPNANQYNVVTYYDPQTGAPVPAQRVVAGVDPSIGNSPGGDATPNKAYGLNGAYQPMLGLGNLDGNDLKTQTNGLQDEYFGHWAVSADATWTLSDTMSVKYIFGYTSYFYDRISDYDLTNNTNFDRQFYVSQQTRYRSHELQFFNDFTPNFSLTTGLFAYHATIYQRGDFFNSTGTGRYTQNVDYSSLAGTAYNFLDQYVNLDTGVISNDSSGYPLFPKVGLSTAKENYGNPNYACSNIGDGSYPRTGPPAAGGNYNPREIFCFGQWAGDPPPGDHIPQGPPTSGSDLEYQTHTERDAYAVYSQGRYQMGAHYALTMGLRWARDQLHGEESLFTYNENVFPLYGNPIYDTRGNLVLPSLTAWNQALGSLSADGATILNQDQLRTQGVPISYSIYRKMYRRDDQWTGRINLDWTPTDKDLFYASVTTGTRSGGFNLVFFSANSTYNPEYLTAYEIGYKGELFNNTMQLNAAAYYYNYDDVHTFAAGPSATGALSVSVFNVPNAEIIGFDTDMLWLATANLTLGAQFSYTHSEYTSNFKMVDDTNAAAPSSLFNPLDSLISIKGNQMVRIPEYKASGYATYDFNLSIGKISATTSVSWIDKVYFSPFNLPTDEADAYTRVDARLTWTSPKENWVVAAFCDNVFDKIGTRQIEAYDESENYRRTGSMTSPRLYGMELRYFFGAYQ